MVACSVNVKHFSAGYARTAVKELRGGLGSCQLFALLITVKDGTPKIGRG